MDHVEGTFKGVRDASIYHQAWLPEGEARAAVLIVHGLGEHSGRYMNVVNALVPRGYAVYALDHLGHGKSEGEREVIERFDDYTNTLTTYLGMVKGWQPGKPVFLLGHSMGGLIATTYLLDHQAEFRGAVISAPAIKVGESVPKATILMGKVLSVIAPKMGVLALDSSAISRDPEVVRAYVNDPLVFHGKTPARLAAEMLKAMQRVTAEVGTISLPFIVMQGSEDRLVDPGGTRMLYEQAGSKDKTLKIYEGFFHEVCNEPECALVLDDVGDWLDAHV
ncbi:MAG: lysophospholipase [Anaerolineae bacterium]|nr:lysophospholipase [Anaerolineae bacterium]